MIGLINQFAEGYSVGINQEASASSAIALGQEFVSRKLALSPEFPISGGEFPHWGGGYSCVSKSRA
jgi:hypothetical protein